MTEIRNRNPKPEAQSSRDHELSGKRMYDIGDLEQDDTECKVET